MNGNDDLVAEALAAYSAALESGRRLDRSAFLAAHAVHQDRLAPLMTQVEGLHGMAENLARAAGLPWSLLPARGRLGDFEIVRLVGRGGMGVVYEAVQVSLSRSVALKVLPSGRELESRARERFLHEARTAALLHHEHIVPVFAVGEDQGVQYYAMPLIDGSSLDLILRQRRGERLACDDSSSIGAMTTECDGHTPRPASPPDDDPPITEVFECERRDLPDPRWVAALGVQAGEALAYAHDRGVIHRDVKPGNLILDARGKLWLTDFGLARVRDVAGATSCGRVGTLRYMAPEQIDSRRGAIDARTDVRALGATLYELLTLRPAFSAGTEAELLRRLLHETPVPLRQIAPTVPDDLARAVHKAIAVEPADRYSSAADLVADLKRFLAGQPVQARPLSPARLAWRWARRRRKGLAITAMTAAIGLILGLAASSAAIWKQKLRADSRDRHILDAIARFGASEEQLRNKPETAGAYLLVASHHKELLCRLADEPDADFQARFDAADSCMKLHTLYSRIGQPERAEAMCRETCQRLETLAHDYPNHPEARYALARATMFRLPTAAPPEAGRLAAQALELYRHLQRDDPQKAEYHNDISTACVYLAADYGARGERDRQIAVLREGLASDLELARRYPDGHPLSYLRLAASWKALALAHAEQGDSVAAEHAFRQGIASQIILARKMPEPLINRGALIDLRLRFGQLLLDLGRVDEAREELHQCLATIRAMESTYPENTQWQGHKDACLQALAQTGEPGQVDDR